MTILRQAQVAQLRAHQEETRKELPLRDAAQSALMPSILDKAFKGEL